MNLPTVSVVMPVYNGARWLPDSLGSIVRQAVPGVELIVVDDGSSEDIASVVRAHYPAAAYFRQPNRGPAAARNAGLSRARGACIAFLDQDDSWPDGSLALRLRALTDDPAALFVLGRTRFVAARGAPEPWVATNFGAGLYRRELFNRIGLLNERCGLTDDLEWFLRVREAAVPYVILAEETLHYRRDTGGLTAGRSWGELEVLATLRASLARRRANGVAAEMPLLSGSRDNPRAAGPVNHDHR